MIEVEEKVEIESRCGIICSECEYLKKGICKGKCVDIDKPFWGDTCQVKKCVEDKNLACCGECKEFPCELLKSFSYAEKEGDNGKRIETCKKWCSKCNNS